MNTIVRNFGTFKIYKRKIVEENGKESLEFTSNPSEGHWYIITHLILVPEIFFNSPKYAPHKRNIINFLLQSPEEDMLEIKNLLNGVTNE